MTALGEYIAEANSGSPPGIRKLQSSKDRLGPQITASNVGYQLLQKAGWQEGQGIGIHQQGRPIPLSAYHQQARHGIGAGNKQANGTHAQHKPRRKRKVDGSSLRPEDVDQAKQTKQQPVPDVPEDPTVKRQRHQQVHQVQSSHLP